MPNTEDKILTASTINAITSTTPISILINPDRSAFPKISVPPAATMPKTEIPKAIGPVIELTIFSTGDSQGIPVLEA